VQIERVKPSSPDRKKFEIQLNSEKNGTENSK